MSRRVPALLLAVALLTPAAAGGALPPPGVPASLRVEVTGSPAPVETLVGGPCAAARRATGQGRARGRVASAERPPARLPRRRRCHLRTLGTRRRATPGIRPARDDHERRAAVDGRAGPAGEQRPGDRHGERHAVPRRDRRRPRAAGVPPPERGSPTTAAPRRDAG